MQFHELYGNEENPIRQFICKTHSDESTAAILASGVPQWGEKYSDEIPNWICMETIVEQLEIGGHFRVTCRYGRKVAMISDGI